MINKKVQCKHCQNILTKNGTCSCQKVSLAENKVVKGLSDIDYVDLSAKLLNE